jgi:hypothetical protein
MSFPLLKTLLRKKNRKMVSYIEGEITVIKMTQFLKILEEDGRIKGN